jgi:uncharacterized membrane protein YedE/YeeE
MSSGWLPVSLAFGVGFAMKWGGLCTYVAARQLVREQRFERLHAFLAAAAFAALLLLPFAWLQTVPLRFAATHELWLTALLAGLVLGAGAWLNHGCVFGTFVQLTGGNPNYLATLLGLAAGASASRLWLSAWAAPATEAAPALHSLPYGLLALGLGLLMVLPLFRRGRQSRLLVALMLGAGGGWLFATVRGWDFAAVVTNGLYFLLDLAPRGPTRLAVYCTLAMIAGGLLAAFLRRKFSLQALRWRRAAACFGGGALMGGAAVILPGGNDSLVLAGLPLLAPHALIGYAAMLAGLVVLFLLNPRR